MISFSDNEDAEVSVQYIVNVRQCNPNDLDRIQKHPNLKGKVVN